MHDRIFNVRYKKKITYSVDQKSKFLTLSSHRIAGGPGGHVVFHARGHCGHLCWMHAHKSPLANRYIVL